MTISLELRPEVLLRSQAAADARGVTLRDYLHEVIAGACGLPVAASDPFESDMDALAGGIAAPPLSDAAVRREALYSPGG